MFYRNAFSVFSLIVFISAFATLSFSINLVSPESKVLGSGDIVDLGTVGPGQTVSILVDPKVNEGGIYGIGGLYDKAIASNLPKGWTSAESKLYQNPLQVTISAHPDTPSGNYSAQIVVIDENNGEKLGNITFITKIRVTWDVMDMSVTPSQIAVGPGQPARFAITISNKGSTSDVFEVSAIGQKRWEFRKPVFVPAHSSKTIYYEIVGTEEETYKSTIRVVSLASKNIVEERNVTMQVESNLLGDYKATNNGVPIFPIFQASIFSIAGLLSNLFS